jgi:hypothetical protein
MEFVAAVRLIYNMASGLELFVDIDMIQGAVAGSRP